MLRSLVVNTDCVSRWDPVGVGYESKGVSPSALGFNSSNLAIAMTGHSGCLWMIGNGIKRLLSLC